VEDQDHKAAGPQSGHRSVWQDDAGGVDPRGYCARQRPLGYHAYDVELATRTTTWTDSAGTRARTLHRYELRIPVREVGTRSWSTEEERQAFIGQSFSDLTVRRLRRLKRDILAHPLASLVGQRLDSVEFVTDWPSSAGAPRASTSTRSPTSRTPKARQGTMRPSTPIGCADWSGRTLSEWMNSSTAVSSSPSQTAPI
jgi:hypothetical protein